MEANFVVSCFKEDLCSVSLSSLTDAKTRKSFDGKSKFNKNASGYSGKSGSGTLRLQHEKDLKSCEFFKVQ
jgi:hypothetical protein